jgi:hypothetical protein
VDRLTNAEVGGPYSNRDDAERAIRAGSFDQDPAELSVQEGDSDSGDGDSDDGGDGSSRTASWGPYETPTTGGTPSPSTPDVPDLAQPRPEQQFPQTTKPAQTPGGSGGLPQDPSGMQFDDGSQTSGSDSLASPTAAVVAMIRQANPGIDDETLIRVATKAVARLVEADFDPFSMMPNISDPLANKTPFGKFVKDPHKKKDDDEDESTEGDDDDDSGDKPGSSLPRFPLPNLGGGAAGGAAGETAGAGAAGEAAGAARLLPMLMV